MSLSPDNRQINNVFCISPIDSAFQDLYLAVRSSENRLYPDEVVVNLPFFEGKQIYQKEWQMRLDSSRKVLSKIRELKFRNILDLGCGNGWFISKVAEIENTTVYGADINMVELEQASRLFTSKGCQFLYWNIFESNWTGAPFDLVVLNSSVQYFDSIKRLTDRLFEFMLPGGSIFIWDSPIYRPEEKQLARIRSNKYFQNQLVPEMINYYYHHTWDQLQGLNYSILYNPNEFSNIVIRKVFKRRSPFYWISILKPN
ncbi:class I SAM-dependent methyltransferase [Algoriphagus sp.]|uniref:class I SAM-dependent methyltransferase n=1 Tax=Algoriphagus sp. TaxID=1872435 RepID=UPI0025F5234E|nr:class I SAM-dependent methyltransferase [Algoriphagus sp.]